MTLVLQQKEFERILLHGDGSRFILRPEKYPQIMAMCKKQRDVVWSKEEIDMADDIIHWTGGRLTYQEKTFVLIVLAFFAGFDCLVMDNLMQRFMSEIKLQHVHQFYAYQNASEAMHTETYSMLITSLIKNKKLLDLLFGAIETHETISEKKRWATKYMDPKVPFKKRLIAFAVVEGIFFSASFCAIFWLKKRGLMPGLTFSNELISRDEGLHVDFAVMLYLMMISLPLVDVTDIIVDGVNAEKNFVDSLFENGDVCRRLKSMMTGAGDADDGATQNLTDDLKEHHRLIGMNKELMKQYVEFVADRLFVSLGYPKYYNSENPFDWMELISLQGKTNFFERRVGEYSLAGSHELRDSDGAMETFTTDADF